MAEGAGVSAESLAQIIAAHGPGVFLLALAGLLALLGLSWRLLRAPSARLPWHSPRLHLALGLLLIAGMAVLFLALADEIPEDETLSRFDLALAGELGRSLSPASLEWFSWITTLGDPLVLSGLGLLIAVLLWLRGYAHLAVLWIIALAGNGLLNRILKAIFERTRPLHDHGYGLAQGWSFPSGHASGALVAYGMLVYLCLRTMPARWHLPALIGAVSLILLVGLSRILLQVHYFSDVIAGYASGAAWLALCIAAGEIAMARRTRRSPA